MYPKSRLRKATKTPGTLSHSYISGVSDCGSLKKHLWQSFCTAERRVLSEQPAWQKKPVHKQEVGFY